MITEELFLLFSLLPFDEASCEEDITSSFEILSFLIFLLLLFDGVLDVGRGDDDDEDTEEEEDIPDEV
jgi:hypothetical protein